MKNSPEQTLTAIREKAIELGFDACGFTQAGISEEFTTWYSQYLGNGLHGKLHYLENNKAKILNPGLLMADAKTVVCLVTHYRCTQQNPNPHIARYAQVNDYHIVLKEKANSLLLFMQGIIPGLQGRVFTDSGVLPEKYYAAKAGLGFIGKNSLLIQPEAGSFMFISAILINRELPADPALQESCGSCHRCIDACPTEALSPYGLDARRCLTYHNIESKEPVPENIVPHLYDHWFGCDICQNVCPWNATTNNRQPRLFHLLKQVTGLTRQKLKDYTETGFDKDFSNTALIRAGLKKLKKNSGCIPSD